MSSVNKVILVGNLGGDPEARTSGSGTTWCTLSIATNERKKDGDQWVDHTEWHKVVCFGKVAENAVQYLRKGRQVYVEGKLRTRKWQDDSGVDRYVTEIVADNVVFLGGGERRDDRDDDRGERPARQERSTGRSSGASASSGGSDW